MNKRPILSVVIFWAVLWFLFLDANLFATGLALDFDKPGAGNWYLVAASVPWVIVVSAFVYIGSIVLSDETLSSSTKEKRHD